MFKIEIKKKLSGGKLNKSKKKKDNLEVVKKYKLSDIEDELKRESYKSKYFKVLQSTIYVLIIIAAMAALVATLIMPVIEISGDSMKPILNEGEIVVTIKNKNLHTGDIVAFYQGNKILVKRVIAGAGSFVNIDNEGNVFVNGKELEEEYVKNKNLGEGDIKYPYQVPDGEWFFLSDDRNNLNDSRNSLIGSVKNDNIIGKVIFRVWPLNKFKIF